MTLNQTHQQRSQYPGATVSKMYNQNFPPDQDMRHQLEQIERQLIPLLRSIQYWLGKVPTETNREERRKLKTK